METDGVTELTTSITQLLDGPAAQVVSVYLTEPDLYSPRRYCNGFGGTELTRLGCEAKDDYADPSPNTWQLADALAITMLDEHLRPTALRRLLSDPDGEQQARLAELPCHLDLWDAVEQKDVLPAMKCAWDALCALPGVGRVQASKLLARKRPRLVPVQDSIVDRFSGYSDRPKYWDVLGRALTSEDLRARIDALRPPGCEDVTTLRLLDILIWMRHSGSTQAKVSRQDAGYP